MKCPTCGAESAVMETRRWADNTTKRRRECAGPAAHRFNSFEVLETVYNTAKHRARDTAKTEQRRATLQARDIEIARTLHLTWQVLAARYNLTKAAVYLAAKRGRNAQMPAMPHKAR